MPELILKEKTIRKRNGGLKIEKEDVTEVYYGDVLVGTFSQVEEMGQKLYLVTNYISDEKKVVGDFMKKHGLFEDKKKTMDMLKGKYEKYNEYIYGSFFDECYYDFKKKYLSKAFGRQ